MKMFDDLDEMSYGEWCRSVAEEDELMDDEDEMSYAEWCRAMEEEEDALMAGPLCHFVFVDMDADEEQQREQRERDACLVQRYKEEERCLYGDD
jgi:hypothetical protein